MAYFRAWTLDKKRGTEVVPHIRQLRSAEVSWEESLRKWLLELPCQETKRYVGNFLAVYRVRPETEAENSDDEDDTDELVVSAAELPEACNTYVAKAAEQTVKGRKMDLPPNLGGRSHSTCRTVLEGIGTALQGCAKPIRRGR